MRRPARARSLGDMWRVELGEDLNLLLDVLNLVLRALKVDDLDRDCLLGALVVAEPSKKGECPTWQESTRTRTLCIPRQRSPCLEDERQKLYRMGRMGARTNPVLLDVELLGVLVARVLHARAHSVHAEHATIGSTHHVVSFVSTLCSDV